MAVSSMQAVNVIGLMNHIDEVITVLGESGVFHPDEVNNFYQDLRGFTHLQSNNSYAEPLTNLKVALNRTKRRFPLTDTSDFNPTFEELDSFSAATAAQIDALTDKKIGTQARLNEARQNLSVAEHFSGLAPDVQEALKLKYTRARFGSLPKDSVEKLEAYKDNEDVDFIVCTEDKTHCWGVYFVPKNEEAQIDGILRSIRFSDNVKVLYTAPAYKEADDFGYDFLKGAGKNPYYMALAFEKLMDKSQTGTSAQVTSIANLFSSHPDTQSRIDRVNKKAAAEGYTRPAK